MNWISVRERVPDDDVYVLVFSDNEMYIVRYRSEFREWDGSYEQSEFSLKDYDYWMPLPKVPNELD